MATPNLAHHNQLQLFNQQRHQNPAYAKERVQAIIQVNPFLSLNAYSSTHTQHSSVQTFSALKVLPRIIIKSSRISYVLSPTFKLSRPSKTVCSIHAPYPPSLSQFHSTQPASYRKNIQIPIHLLL